MSRLLASGREGRDAHINKTCFLLLMLCILYIGRTKGDLIVIFGKQYFAIHL